MAKVSKKNAKALSSNFMKVITTILAVVLILIWLICFIAKEYIFSTICLVLGAFILYKNIMYKGYKKITPVCSYTSKPPRIQNFRYGKHTCKVRGRCNKGFKGYDKRKALIWNFR